MARCEQGKKDKGSQKWLQTLINEQPTLIASAFRNTAKLSTALDIEWLSPLQGDNYAEYRDQSFLELLGIGKLPERALADFWPSRGPVWDGLGRSEKGDLLLIEAKSHIPGIVSTSCGAGGVSKKRIDASLQETKDFLPLHPTPIGRRLTINTRTVWRIFIFCER